MRSSLFGRLTRTRKQQYLFDILNRRRRSRLSIGATTIIRTNPECTTLHHYNIITFLVFYTHSPYCCMVQCHCYRMCVCVFSSHSFRTSSSLDVPAGVTQEEGHTGFLIHLLSAVRALIFLARRIQPFLSLVDCEVEFCVLSYYMVLEKLNKLYYWSE